MFPFQQLPLVAFVDVSRFNAHLYSEVVRRSIIINLQRLVQIRSQLFRDERLELEVHDHVAQMVPVVLHSENVALPLVVLPAAVVLLVLNQVEDHLLLRLVRDAQRSDRGLREQLSVLVRLQEIRRRELRQIQRTIQVRSCRSVVIINQFI